MKKISYTVTLVIAMAVTAFFSLSSCHKLPEPPNTSIIQTISANPDFSLLTLALDKTGYTRLINNSPSVTLFAPDNAAFTQFGLTEQVINNLAADSTGMRTLQVIIGYHLVGQAIPKYKIPAGGQLETLSGAYLFTSNTPSGIAINTSYLPDNYTATANGVYYQLHQVLTPTGMSMQEHIDTDTSLSLLAAAVAKDSLVIFNSTTTFHTLFAPVNDAFRVAGIHDTTELFTLTRDSIHTILLHHVLNNTHLLTTDIINNMQVRNMNDSSIALGTNPFSVFPIYQRNPVSIPLTNKDTIAFNGVIHYIRKLLIP